MEFNHNEAPSPRLPLQLGVEYRKSYGRQGDSGTLRNISLTGAYLATENPELEPKDKLTITFVVSGRKREIKATVVWKNNIGCGIQFQPFNNRDVQIVDDLMYFVESSRESRRSVFDQILKKVS